MKNKYRLVIAIVLLLMSIQFAIAAENEYGEVKAWCNGEPATVNDLEVKVGEPVNITVKVTSRIYGFIDIQLNEPWATHSYDVISGPGELDEWITEPGVEPGWSGEYTWILAPNGDWTGGRSPIMVDVSFYKDIDDKLDAGFTIASPVILDEEYYGPVPTRTAADPSSTDQTPSQGSPGFGVVGAVLGIAFVVVAMRD
jgi:sarcinarray family protein